MYRLIDTHAHLEEIANLDQALYEAKSVGITVIIAVGSDYQSNQKILELARINDGFIYPALGLHPWNLKDTEVDSNLEYIEANIGKIIAIGEIGLDYHKKVRAIAEKDLQKRVLKKILQIAKANNKSVIIHSRYAWRDAFDLVKEAQLENAVFHWFTGTSSVLRDIINQGYYISATPAVEYHEEHRRAIKETPLEKLLLETDSPVTYGRGRESEFESRPADVLRVLRGASELKGISETEVAQATTENALKLFRIQN